MEITITDTTAKGAVTTPCRIWSKHNLNKNMIINVLELPLEKYGFKIGIINICYKFGDKNIYNSG